MKRRVVVTGLGAVTPLGGNIDLTWKRLLAGENSAKRVDEFEVDDIACKIACPVRFGDGSGDTFNADAYMEPKEQRKVDRFILFAIAAAQQAIEDSGWHPKTYEEQISTGVMVGSGIGGLMGIENCARVLEQKGPRRLSPFFIPSCLINLASGTSRSGTA